MRRALLRHPASPCAAIERIEAEAVRREGRLLLTFLAHGDIAAVRWPESRPPTREDGLWKRTCFEAFVQAPPSGAYCEWNLSPSSQWAAYRFESYRKAMAPLPGATTPRIETFVEPRRYELRAAIDLGPAAWPQGEWRLGLSAVIEEAGGALSYWALAHPSPTPDFHNAAGFVYEAPLAEAS